LYYDAWIHEHQRGAFVLMCIFLSQRKTTTLSVNVLIRIEQYLGGSKRYWWRFKSSGMF